MGVAVRENPCLSEQASSRVVAYCILSYNESNGSGLGSWTPGLQYAAVCANHSAGIVLLHVQLFSSENLLIKTKGAIHITRFFNSHTDS